MAATPVRQIAVAATTQFIQDFVKNVGGNRVAVSGLLNSDADPHDYEPTVQDVQKVAQAEIIFVHGLDLDAWIEDVIKNARTIDRTIREEETALLREVLDKYMPGACGPEVRRITCLEAYSGDDHFIIGRHPEHPQVLLGCGFSGRGFKFGPTTGEILADLAVDGRTRHQIGFLAPDRFARQAVAA